MAAYTRKNALDQELDVKGSLSQYQERILADEPAGLGCYDNQGTTALSFAAAIAGTQNITGMSGMIAADVGRYFNVVSGPTNAVNIGSFIITAVNTASDIDVTNAAGVLEGPVSSVWKITGSDNLTFGAPAAGIQNITGVTGAAANWIGRFLQVVSGPAAGNIGTFLIVAYNGAGDIDVVNAAGAAGGPTACIWNTRLPYSLEDDLNFERTDRRLIKGTASFASTLPTYNRPTDLATDVPCNLTEINEHTTDAMALCVNRKFENQTVAATNTHVTMVDTSGSLKHAGANDRTGVPIQDGADAANLEACYVEIINPATETSLEVQAAGPQHGWRIFGYTRAGAGGVAAAGQIDTDLQNTFINGDLFTMHDGTALGVVTYYFDVTGAYVPPGGYGLNKIRLNVSADVTATDIRDTIIAAINGSTQAITAAIVDADSLSVTNDNIGAQGNQTMTKTVVGPSAFAVTGLTGGTMSLSPYSVDVEFRCVAPGAPLSTSVAYTWEATPPMPTTIDLFYGYRSRLDQFADTDLRTVLTNGLVGDATLQSEIDDILTTVGTVKGDTSLTGLLTPDTNYYVWSDLPDATPSVVEALNTINTQIGDRDYDAPGDTIITDGETITDSLQALADAIAGATVERIIERLAVNVPAGTYHLLPGGKTYTPSGPPYYGQNMWVFWRGVLRDPGLVVDGDDYEETDGTHITNYYIINQNDHINYMIYA